MRHPAGVWALILLATCAACGLNEGEIDYRKAGPAARPSGADPGSGTETRVLPLLNKYDEVSDQSVYNTETVSVHLLHAYVKDFIELGVHGEVAILGRVFELGEGKSYDFSPGAAKEHGRLLYYTEDARQGGHHLNFSAMPVYGPIRYEGRSLMLEFHILELDSKDNAKFQGILKTVASLGSVAYPPASPILKVLDSVGSELLSGDRDDREFRYHFALHPAGGKDETNYPRLEAGNYILVKQDPGSGTDRPFANTPWSSLHYDQNTGCVVTRDEAGAWRNWEDATYIVIQINRGLPAVAMDVAQKFSEFEEKLKASSDQDVHVMQAATQAIVSGIVQMRQGATAEKLIGDLALSQKIEDPERRAELRTRLLGELMPILKAGVDERNPTLTPEQVALYLGRLQSLMKTAPITTDELKAILKTPEATAALMQRF